MAKKYNPVPPPPPLGNQRAVGHGRPPNPGYSDPELIVLGEELLAWMKEVDEKDINVVHLSQWYSEIKAIPYSQWKSLIINRSCFIPYYERAISWMGRKTMQNTALPTAYGSRFLGIYCAEVREHEREIVEHKVDYELAKKEAMDKQRPLNDGTIGPLLEELKALKEKMSAPLPQTDKIV